MGTIAEVTVRLANLPPNSVKTPVQQGTIVAVSPLDNMDNTEDVGRMYSVVCGLGGTDPGGPDLGTHLPLPHPADDTLCTMSRKRSRPYATIFSHFPNQANTIMRWGNASRTRTPLITSNTVISSSHANVWIQLSTCESLSTMRHHHLFKRVAIGKPTCASLVSMTIN